MFRTGIIVFFLLVMPLQVFSSEVTIRPFLIDHTLEPRESATETIRLTSEYDVRKAVMFATVNEITVGPDGEIKEFISPVMTDRSRNVTSWIEISRGRIEIAPMETTEIPISVSVHPHAEPGDYYAFVGFVETNKRFLAEQVAMDGEADGLILKVTVADSRVDSMRINRFEIDRLVTDPEDQRAEITIENPGELTSVPAGELIFYNNRGQEIASAVVNPNNTPVLAGEERVFSVAIPFEGDMGRFKSNLNLRYGVNQQASLYDTTSFFMVPWWYLVVLGVILLSLILLLMHLFRRALSDGQAVDEGGQVTMYVRDGHEPNPQDHDIDLSTK